LALCLRHGSQALGAEQVNAGLVMAEITFEADEDNGRGGEKVKDFGVPLGTC
jgi:hypothetical protein